MAQLLRSKNLISSPNIYKMKCVQLFWGSCLWRNFNAQESYVHTPQWNLRTKGQVLRLLKIHLIETPVIVSALCVPKSAPRVPFAVSQYAVESGEGLRMRWCSLAAGLSPPVALIMECADETTALWLLIYYAPHSCHDYYYTCSSSLWFRFNFGPALDD
jgi:hypothetical protein